MAAINITANIGNKNPVVDQIRVCDGTCSYAKTIEPQTHLTVEVNATDPNGQDDLNWESLRIELYTDSDLNGDAEDWDHNTMTILDDNIWLATSNGCVQAGTIYCINIPESAWTTKFLNGDANIFIMIDDNSTAQDWNSIPAGALSINQNLTRSEDAASGTYTADPNTADNAINSSEGNAYITTTHSGNVDIDVTIRATDLNVSQTVYIGDDNQSWALQNDSSIETPFTGGQDLVMDDLNRGSYPDSNSEDVWMWLDVPDQQPAGAYTGTLTYNATAS